MCFVLAKSTYDSIGNRILVVSIRYRLLVGSIRDKIFVVVKQYYIYYKDNIGNRILVGSIGNKILVFKIFLQLKA